MAHYKETDLLKLMKKENRIQRICDYVKNMEKEYYNNDSDKGGIISEGIFQFSPILKRTKPNQCPSFFLLSTMSVFGNFRPKIIFHVKSSRYRLVYHHYSLAFTSFNMF